MGTASPAPVYILQARQVRVARLRF